MFGFFVKKSFFDGWDHLAGLALVNSGFLLAASPLLVMGIPGLSSAVALACMILAGLLISIWFGLASAATIRYADFGDFPFADFLPTLRKAVLPGLQLGIVLLGLMALVGVGLPFYLRLGTFGALAAGVILWAGLALLLALQYYLPLRLRLGGGFAKNLRKSFFVFFDNPAMSVALLGWSLILLIISFFLAFLAPGLAGIALAHNVAVRFLLKKYDWLKVQAAEIAAEGQGSRQSRPKIPWAELLAEDRELVGPRSLKGMIFPWKE